MPTITSALFVGECKVDTSDWKKISVPGFGPRQVSEFLETFGWDGSAAASVGLRMAADNESVTAARLSIVGCWAPQPARVQAQKLWARAPADIWLEIDLQDIGTFRFADNDMASCYIPDVAVKHNFTTQGEDGQQKTLSDEEVTANNITPFALRAACGLSSASSATDGVWLTCAVVVYPASEEEMAALSTAYKSPAWPGIKLAEGDLPILPRAGKNHPALNGKEWGCPITPALIPGAPWEETGKKLEQTTVTAAIGNLLNSGQFPNCAASADSLKKKWDTAQRAPEKLTYRKPEVTWPATHPSTAANKKGKH